MKLDEVRKALETNDEWSLLDESVKNETIHLFQMQLAEQILLDAVKKLKKSEKTKIPRRSRKSTQTS